MDFGTLLHPDELIRTIGLIGVIVVVFAESGLLVGFFLPGDSLLFTAGLFAYRGDLPIAILLPGVFAAAVIGDQVGYVFGRRVGPALFRRPDSRFFQQEYVDKAQAYFARYGAKTIVLARFIPIVRTFAPILAGVGRMPYRTFVTFNVVGGALWGLGVTSLGYLFGEAFERLVPGGDVDRYLLPIIAVIIGLSLLPVVREVLAARREQRAGATAAEAAAEAAALAEDVRD